jgi:hypothetical protein
VSDHGLEAQLAALGEYMERGPLTASIAQLEHAMAGCDTAELADRLEAHGMTPDVLRAAFVARDNFGRINDLIHAAAISLALPHILEPGEKLHRPSLAAGNDPTRLYDVETDRRIAEFKLSRWDGHDGGRKRQLLKDLVHLAAADHAGRSVELYVLGARPAQFLTTTRSVAEWGLNRGADKTREMFVQRFGSLQTPIPEFVSGPAAHVHIIDLEQRLPQLFAPS